MRARWELAALAILATLGLASALKADGQGWICNGSTNCYTQACVSGSQGYSCSQMTAVDHPKCSNSLRSSDNCTDIKVNCVKIQNYNGDPCKNGQCGGMPIGDPTYSQEWGCST